MMAQFATGMGVFVLAGAMMAAGSGCVVVNVGKPEVFTHTETMVTTGKTPIRAEVLSVDAKAEVNGNELRAWLDADVQGEYNINAHEEKAVFTHQKKMAIGFFPGAAEFFYAPTNAVKRAIFENKLYGEADLVESGGEFAFVLAMATISIWGSAVATIPSLFVHPFTPWSCSQECYQHYHFGSIGNTNWTDARAEILARFPDATLKAANIKLVRQEDIRNRMENQFIMSWDLWSHMGLLGVHKYPVITDVWVEKTPKRKTGVETKRETKRVPGPYEVELRVKGTGIAGKTEVRAGGDKATFVLPQVECGGAYEATLTFRSLFQRTQAAQGDDDIRSAWNTKTLTKTVWLQEKPKPKPAEEKPRPQYDVHVTYTPPPPPVDMDALADKIAGKLKGDAQERKAEGAPILEQKTVDGAGRTVWRFRMREGQNAFDEADPLKPKILKELRDDFAGRNPQVPRGEINAWATYTVEDGGRTLVYVGGASSLIPSLESLSYSAETHRGIITMRLSGGTDDLRRVKEFVRQNISAIVCDKNVTLTAGERPPDGAAYRSLDENYADGVLAVEFEAEE